MIYKQLTQEYMDDVIAEAMFIREREHFHYALDYENMQNMLKLAPEGPFKQNLVKRLGETAQRMQEVDIIYAALESRVEDQQRHIAAVTRVQAKRAAVESAALTAQAVKG